MCELKYTYGLFFEGLTVISASFVRLRYDYVLFLV